MDTIRLLRDLLGKPHYILNGFKHNFFLPDEEMCSIADINPLRLIDNGIEGLVIDIDQTIIDGYNGLKVNKRIKPYYRALATMFKTCHLSNTSPERIKKLEQVFCAPIMHPRKQKPSYCAFGTAIHYLGLPTEKIAVIGDMIYMDISAANRLGMYTIKVEPLAPKKDPLTVKVWRDIEKTFEECYRD